MRLVISTGECESVGMHTPTEPPENSGELTGGVRSREVVQSRSASPLAHNERQLRAISLSLPSLIETTSSSTMSAGPFNELVEETWTRVQELMSSTDGWAPISTVRARVLVVCGRLERACS